MKKRKRTIRYIILGSLLLLVWLTQMLPFMGEIYARTIYPVSYTHLDVYKRQYRYGYRKYDLGPLRECHRK